VLPTISDCTFERGAKVGVHPFEAFARPRASLFIAGLRLLDFRTMSDGPVIPKKIGHDAASVLKFRQEA
jgi:hypothetical protein